MSSELKSRKMFEFLCESHGRFDALAYDKDEKRLCPSCGAKCGSVISAVRSHLDGTDPAFPTAWERWAKVHEEKARQEKEKEAREGA